MDLTFEQGTVVIEGWNDPAPPFEHALWDERTRQWRAPAYRYRDLILSCRSRSLSYRDHARRYDSVQCRLVRPLTPRPHQTAALKAWVEQGRRGVVQLPTGAGKTFLALLAMVQTGRSTLVTVPTIDLLHQWHDVLSSHFGMDIGVLGGGQHEILPLTVATYDSAALHIERLGDRFGLLVLDECHHLPAPQYQNIALASIAPFRLGLSATVERADGKEAEIFRLVGPLVYEGRIDQMVSSVLSPYDVVSIQVPMSDDEEADYRAARAVYTGFLKRFRIDFSNPRGWMEFVQKSARLPGGREAMKAYREQKRLAQASEAKIGELWRILREHTNDRMIVFTEDNAMAYRIGREFILPVLTHQTRLKERKAMLEGFRQGDVSIIVTSKVLNEGVDVPEARVGVVVSGSGGVREHVQRLGRILRHRPGKRAILYEIISKGTSEFYVNRRRRQHHAYQGST